MVVPPGGAPVLVVAADGDPERVGPVVVAGAPGGAGRRSGRGPARRLRPCRCGGNTAPAPGAGRRGGATPHAAHDMVGTLREWTASQYRPYPYRKDDGREAPDRTATRGVRGASHDDGADALRATIRPYHVHRGTARGHHHVGFRCSTSEDLGGR